MSDNANETIIKMVKQLKSSTKTEFNIFTPIKRSLGNSSNEDTPEKRFKRDVKEDMSYVGSPREMRRLRADLVEARNNIRNLQSRISQMNSAHKQLHLAYEDDTHQLKKQQEYDRKSIDELENQLLEIKKREIALKNELAQANAKLGTLKIKSETEVADLEKSLSDMKEENRHNEYMEGSEISSLKRELNQLKLVLQAAEENTEAQKKIVVELEKRLGNQVELTNELEMKDQALQKAKLHIKELEYAKENFLEYQEQAKNQAHKLSNYIELEREVIKLKEENAKLKDGVRHKLILEEEVHDLKGRLGKYKVQGKHYVELQAQQVQNEMFLNEWRAVARGICETSDADSTLPHKLRAEVEKLQQQEINLTASKVELESQLKNALHEAKVAKSELEKCQKYIASMKITGDQKQNLIHRIQKKLLLVSRERDSYRLQLDSYEKDLTMNTTSMGSAMASQFQSQKDRISKLEKINDGYKDLIAKLESDLECAQPRAYADGPSYKLDQVNKLEDEISVLKAEVNRLRERNDQLEIQLESYVEGNDTLAGGKVYHLENNPLAVCLAKRENMVEQLEKEVERLTRKVKNLEQGIDTSKLGDLTICPQEMMRLKEQIKSHESQIQKLKDYFRTSMQDFRNVIYILLGYKVDRSGTSLYKLRNVYAENENDILCFELNKDGEMKLLENDYSATLEDMINIHLRHQNSFPVFLSAITINLFGNRTKTFTA